VRVQEQAPQAKRAQLVVELLIPVFLVARHRVSGVGGVHANLVRAASQQARFQQRRQLTKELHHMKLCG
jgi:hypothetical protein